MASTEPRSPRRNFVQRGLLLLTGALGVGAATKVGRPETPTPVSASIATPIALTLFGQNWHLLAENRRSGALPDRGQRMAQYGELLDAPGGAKLGEFYSACFCVGTPFGASDLSAETVEMHTFKLQDGSLIGMGTASWDESTFAIVGGTGRYLGATGSYVAAQRPREIGGAGDAEFRFTVKLQEHDHAA